MESVLFTWKKNQSDVKNLVEIVGSYFLESSCWCAELTPTFSKKNAQQFSSEAYI